ARSAGCPLGARKYLCPALAAGRPPHPPFDRRRHRRGVLDDVVGYAGGGEDADDVRVADERERDGAEVRVQAQRLDRLDRPPSATAAMTQAPPPPAGRTRTPTRVPSKARTRRTSSPASRANG